MRIDKKTGDIIFDDNIVLKAGMTIDEIKNSRVRELLREKSLKEIDSETYLLFKPIRTDDYLVYMDIDTLSNKVHDITIQLDEAVDIYNTGVSNEEFLKLKELYREFLKKTLQVDNFENELKFKWGYIEISGNSNIPVLEVNMEYIKWENTADKL